MNGRLLAILGIVLAAVLGATSRPRDAAGLERNFVGSAQLDYLVVPTDDVARRMAFDGFTAELALKLAVDFSDHVSANVKMCYGCHGFELPMAFFDVRVADELNFRMGRFIPAFGDFPLRHDPANHRASDKPLPYDMGRMLRLREWGMSVLPAPYVDNGLEVNGVHWFGEDVQIDYAAYAVGGFKGGADATDLDFIQSRSGALYYVDNNSRPSLGGRLAMTANLTDRVAWTVGASGMRGTYDPGNELVYAILGADSTLRFDRLTLRGEYLVRRTEMARGGDPASRFRYGPGPDGTYDRHFLKDGFYVEAERPFGRSLELLARFDGMTRVGNVVSSSPLRDESAVLRYTLGANFLLDRALRLKVSGEFYDFSDFDDEVATHVGLAGSF